MKQKMYTCIWCGVAAASLYRRFENGITKLSHCTSCGNIVDIYTEYDNVLLLIDILLHKSKAFKHILFNMQSNVHKHLFLLYLLCDTYTKLILLPYSVSAKHKENHFNWNAVLEKHFVQMFVITLSEYCINFSIVYLLVNFCCYLYKSKISCAEIMKVLMLSSYGKLFNMAASVWGVHELLLSTWLTNIFVITSNIIALNELSASNADLLKALKETQQRQTDAGDNTATIAKMPEFESKRDEIIWKLNYAKSTLKKAREFEKMAKKAAVHFGYYDGNKQGHSEVTDLIGKADDVLMSAGDKMGFEYERY